MLFSDLPNPNYFNQDLSIRRDFLIRRVKLVAGLDVFNVFNTVVFGGINTNITSAAFGRVSSQVNAPRGAAQGSRRILASLRATRNEGCDHGQSPRHRSPSSSRSCGQPGMIE